MATNQEFLRQLRQEKQFSREALAKAAGVSPQTVAQWESGKAQPDAAQLNALRCLLGKERTDETPAPSLMPFFVWEAVGAVPVLLGYYAAHSYAVVAAGMVLQLIGILLFEKKASAAAKGNHLSRMGLRSQFYGIAVWLFAFAPAHLLVDASFAIYPDIFSNRTKIMNLLIVYLLCSICTRMYLQEKAKGQ